MSTGESTERSAVVVTGAASGIGRAIATKLSADGIAVVAVDLNDSGLGQLRAATELVETVCGDITNPTTLREAADVAEEIAPLRGWVNNAAVFSSTARPLHETPSTEIQRVLNVNLLAAIDGARVAVERFMATGLGGAIVNISSVHARLAFAGWSAYGIAKAGLEGLTRSVAVEYGRHGIRVNAVAPALVTVERWHDQQAHLLQAEAVARTDDSVGMYPLGRLADPAEIADVVAFLLSDARFITGVTLPVDGGFTIRGESTRKRTDS